MSAALIAPIDVPITQSGSIPASCSASIDADLIGAEGAAALKHQHASGRAWPLRSRAISCAFPFEGLRADLLRCVCDFARDQARAALIGKVVPEPIDRDREAASEADQEPDVGNGPDEPGEEPAQLEARPCR